MAKTKGTNLVDMVKFLRTQREAAQALLPPHLHSYLNTQLNVSAWYPEAAIALWKSMHDTGESRMKVDEDFAEAQLAGYGHPTAEMCVMLGAYLQELFALAGVRDPKAEERSCCRSGAPACSWRIEWESAQA